MVITVRYTTLDIHYSIVEICGTSETMELRKHSDVTSLFNDSDDVRKMCVLGFVYSNDVKTCVITMHSTSASLAL